MNQATKNALYLKNFDATKASDLINFIVGVTDGAYNAGDSIELTATDILVLQKIRQEYTR